MSSWCEIVRYRANVEALFSVTYDEKCVWTEKVLKRSEKN
jgi:hypothetical protein